MSKMQDVRVVNLVNVMVEHARKEKMSMEEVDVAYETVKKLYYTDGLIKG